MTAPPPRRPWWRRCRTWAAAAALLFAAYLSGNLVAIYACARGWISDGVLETYEYPLSVVLAPWDYAQSQAWRLGIAHSREDTSD